MSCRKWNYIYQNKKIIPIRKRSQNKQPKSKTNAGLWFLLPNIIGVSIFVLIPFLDVIRRSFTSAISNQFVGISNYREVLTNKAFQSAAANTIKFTIICIPLLLVLSLAIAVFIYRLGKKGNLFKSLFLIPLAVPVASIVLLWKYLFHNQGLLNGFFHFFHGKGVDWMNTKYSFWILIFTYLWKNIGYTVVLWIAGLSSIPESIYEAARVDGAGEWKCFWFITLPNLLPSFFTITVLSLLNSFKVFREAYLISGNYPEEHIYLLQHLFQNWFRDLSLDKLSAAAVLVFLVIFLLILLLKKAGHIDEDNM